MVDGPACAARAGGSAQCDAPAAPAAVAGAPGRHRSRLDAHGEGRQAGVRRGCAGSAVRRSGGGRQGRTHRDRVAAANRLRGRSGRSQGRRRAGAGPGLAQDDHAPCRRRGEPRADARVRARSPYAVQARRGLFRRGRHRARFAEEGNTRRLCRGTEDGRGPGVSAGRRLGSGRRRRGARSADRAGRAPANDPEPPARGPATRDGRMAPAGDLDADRADRRRRGRRDGTADLAEARLRDRHDAARGAGARAGRRVECPASAARATHRGIQLSPAEEICVPGGGAGGRRRHQAAPRRHLAHAVRGEDDGEGQGRAP